MSIRGLHTVLRMFRVSILIALSCSAFANGFTTVPAAFVTLEGYFMTKSSLHSSTPGDSSNGGDMDLPFQQSDAQRNLERLMEQLSLEGAERIAAMTVPERAKRAMLAEAIEDRIFALTESLEGLFAGDGTLPEQNREKAVEIAKQIKGLQIQYEELVSGKPSTVLRSLESVMGPNKDSGQSD